ncbi:MULTISPECIES: hypothetical protein [Protofrankia]|uniref:hypothetical protein n=1 Tax=Protofrankia TaxID=2994361 RepID=UPI0002EE0D09|nr:MULTISPECIES: hypothetical protein [Protofrankia]
MDGRHVDASIDHDWRNAETADIAYATDSASTVVSTAVHAADPLIWKTSIGSRTADTAPPDSDTVRAHQNRTKAASRYSDAA